MSNPKIMVLMLSFGSGHVRAAQSLAVELKKRQPTAEILMLDALEHCSLIFRVFYVWPYWLMIRYLPGLWKKFFQTRLDRQDKQTAPVWTWKKGCRPVFTSIKDFRPDLIVACEVGASEIAVIARRMNLTDAEIINVITDFETEPIWVKPEISAYAVATEDVKEQLEKWGAEDGKIEVCGIPLDDGFAVRHDLSKTRTRFNLDERPLVLLMGGGMGPTRMDQVAAFLLQSGENLNIIALAGHDRLVLARLKSMQSTVTVKLTVLSWTDQVASLMQAASVLVTKPGGVTLAEAAVCGLPLVLFDPIPGPEVTNAARFVAARSAVLTTGSEEAAMEVLRILGEKEVLSAMSANIKKLAQPKSTKKIADLIFENIVSAAGSENIQLQAKNITEYRQAAVWKRHLMERKVTVDLIKDQAHIDSK